MLRYNEETKRIEGKAKDPYTGNVVDIKADVSLFKEEDITTIQIILYAMIGGGFLGSFAMRQPADFYIDSRVGKLPYGRKDILQVANVLEGVARYFGKDPHNLPEPYIVSCWIF